MLLAFAVANTTEDFLQHDEIVPETFTEAPAMAKVSTLVQTGASAGHHTGLHAYVSHKVAGAKRVKVALHMMKIAMAKLKKTNKLTHTVCKTIHKRKVCRKTKHARIVNNTAADKQLKILRIRIKRKATALKKLMLAVKKYRVGKMKISAVSAINKYAKRKLYHLRRSISMRVARLKRAAHSSYVSHQAYLAEKMILSRLQKNLAKKIPRALAPHGWTLRAVHAKKHAVARQIAVTRAYKVMKEKEHKCRASKKAYAHARIASSKANHYATTIDRLAKAHVARHARIEKAKAAKALFLAKMKIKAAYRRRAAARAAHHRAVYLLRRTQELTVKMSRRVTAEARARAKRIEAASLEFWTS
jgi:hypothetical protein